MKRIHYLLVILVLSIIALIYVKTADAQMSQVGMAAAAAVVATDSDKDKSSGGELKEGEILEGGETALDGSTNSDLVKPNEDPLINGGFPDTPRIRESSSVLRVQDTNPIASPETDENGKAILPIGDGTSVIVR